MGKKISTVEKISTGIQGLDKVLLGGLQLPLIETEEDVSSNGKGIIIVLKGNRGTDKTLFAMQMMHGIAKSLRHLEVQPKSPIFYSLDKTEDQMNDMLLDFIISQCIRKMIKVGHSGQERKWTGSLFADAIFETGKICAGTDKTENPPTFPENLKSMIDYYISEGLVYYNIRTNSLHFRTARSVDSKANILFVRKYDKIDAYQECAEKFPTNGEDDFKNDFFEVIFNPHIQEAKEKEYRYTTTSSHVFSKILSDIQRRVEESGKEKRMPSSCIVIDGLTKVNDSDLKSFDFSPFEDTLRKSALVSIIVIDDLDEKMKIGADILIEMGRMENEQVNYTSHGLRICKSVFQMSAYGWHQYKKRDYGIEVYPSSHLLLQQKRYLQQSVIYTRKGLLEDHYLRYASTRESDNLNENGELLEYEEYNQKITAERNNTLRTLLFKQQTSKNVTFNDALQDLIGYREAKTNGKFIALLGKPNSFKFYLSAGSCFCAAKRGIHTLFFTYDRVIDNLREYVKCPAWNNENELKCLTKEEYETGIIKGEKLSCSTDCTIDSDCKLKECSKCYEKIHPFNINMGCISTDELLYFLDEQLSLCFEKENKPNRKIGRIIIDDLQKIDYSFPLLNGNNLFLSAIKNYCQRKNIDLIILCDKEAQLAQRLRSLADNVLCMERDEEKNTLSIFIEKYSGNIPPSKILKGNIRIESESDEETKGIYNIFSCKDGKCNLKFDSDLNSCTSYLQDFWGK